MATHDVAGRILASWGKGGPVDSHFKPCADVPKAGVLFALPAGYYQLGRLSLLMAFLALARVKSLESLRYCAPGEWGKVLGLDRIPEVRTLREKLQWLGQEDKVGAWAARLPEHYVSRQRLCSRATTDYWINAMDGQPFFVVHRPLDPGLLQVLEKDVIPRLEREVPNQPSAEALAADSNLDKVSLVFDREGHSPEALKRFKERRIGCLTYHKHPGPDWPVDQFKAVKVKLAHGNKEELLLAERVTVLSNGFSVREIRHLDGSGHQTAVLATTWKLSEGAVAAGMFGRWSQENFLKYMREHCALDRLVSYQVAQMDETTQVVNPAWRKLDRAVRSLTAKLHPRLARFEAMNLAGPIDPEAVESFPKKRKGPGMRESRIIRLRGGPLF